MNLRKSGKFAFVRLSMDLPYLFISAIYCTTGEQAYKRAKEGFEMVSCSDLIDDVLSDRLD